MLVSNTQQLATGETWEQWKECVFPAPLSAEEELGGWQQNRGAESLIIQT